MKRICFAGALALAAVVSGCATRVVYTSAPPPPPPPPVVVQSPPPSTPPTAPAPSGDAQSAQAAAPQPAPATAVPPPPATPPSGYVPDYYVWDGSEYVGVYGDQYVYWTGGAWVMCPPVIIARFHGWEHYHPYWHRGGVHYYYHGRGRWR